MSRPAQPTAGDGEVRIGPVAAIPRLLKTYGVHPNLTFRRAGVPLRAFRNPENRIAIEDLGRLLAEGARATNRADFSLLAGESFELEGLGHIGSLMRNCPQGSSLEGAAPSAPVARRTHPHDLAR